jgi:hypothetical protein
VQESDFLKVHQQNNRVALSLSLSLSISLSYFLLAAFLMD